jgi:hypothetical protein
MNSIEKKSLCAGKFLDTQFVDTVIRSYKKEKWTYNSERIGKEDSLTSWISVAEMEDLVEKIKSHGGNGIRICFAAYPVDYAPSSQLAGRQTVVLVATKLAESGAGNKDLYVCNGTKTEILAFGQLPSCPPFCLSADGYHHQKVGTGLLEFEKNGLSVI